MGPQSALLFCGKAVLSQSEICSTERLTRLPVLMACCPSMLPTAEKAQHVPTPPWFFTLVTALCSLQSQKSGTSE